MRFGSAKDVITPPFKMKIACSGKFDADFEYIHDDVFVRCLVMDDGKAKTAMFAFDILFHDRGLNHALEAYASETYGIAPSAVIIGSTHTHMGPASSGYNRDFYSPEYEVFMLDRAKTCLDRAMCSMYDGTVEHAVFDAEFNISRRGIVNGQFANFPAPTRKRDTEFALLIVRDLFGNVRSIVMSYACHPVFYPAQSSISAEFPGRVCQLLDTKYYGCTSLFFQSSGGDVRPAATVVDGKFASPLPFSHINRFAQDITDAVSAVVDKKRAALDLSIASDAFAINLPMNPITLDAFKEKLQMYSGHKTNPNYLNANYIVNEGGYDKLAESLDLHCQTVQLTEDLVIATVGGEPTSGVRNRVEEGLAGKKVFFIGYTDACAYIVDDTELAEGGYEATCHNEYCLKGPFQSGLDERFRKGFAASLKNVK